jgi:hypothetical protein
LKETMTLHRATGEKWPQALLNVPGRIVSASSTTPLGVHDALYQRL